MKLNEEQVAFNFQLGYAITRWASVEQSILEFGTSCLLEDDRKAFGYAFCQLDSFRAKLALIDGIAAVKHKGKKDLLADWATLQKMTRALSATRAV